MQEKYKHLTLEPGRHRAYVGGVGDLWESVGLLQFDMLKKNGLTPHATLLDLGCGALRLGVHAIPFLNDGNYFGIDMHQSLLDAGLEHELSSEIAQVKHPQLLANATFDVGSFGVRFDFIIAQSLFTHLPLAAIEQCIASMPQAMHVGSKCFFTFFELTDAVPVRKIDEEPYHQPWLFYQRVAVQYGLRATYIGDWNHPRGQKLAYLTLC